MYTNTNRYMKMIYKNCEIKHFYYFTFVAVMRFLSFLNRYACPRDNYALRINQLANQNVTIYKCYNDDTKYNRDK